MRPAKILYLDIETNSEEIKDRTFLTFRLAWSCYVDHLYRADNKTEVWQDHKDSEKLWSYIESKAGEKAPLTLFTHNAFFDLQGSKFFEYFTVRGWRQDFFHEKGLSFLLTIRKDKRTIKIISSTNYYAESLKEIGKALGLDKGDYQKEKVSEETLSAYCKNDVLILKTAMENWFKFIDENDMGNFAGTKAAQSMAAFRHRFLKHQIYIHENDEVKEFEQEYYIAGRVECFRFGKIKNGPFLALDINSMYPYVMKTFPLPVKLIDYHDHPTLEKLEETLKHHAAIARVALETDLPLYPIKKKHKIIHPVGRFYATIGTPFLKEAMQRGHIKKVLHYAVYRQEVIFNEFVDHFYNLRLKYKEEGNLIFQKIVKILMNSLYGKFGQFNPLQTSSDYDGALDYSREVVLDAKTGDRGMISRFLNREVVEMGRKLSPSSMLSITAHITEYSRHLLWSIIEPLYPNHVLYCDTDSIFIREKDLKQVKHPLHDIDLGALKIDKRFKALEIRGAKHYVYDGHLVCRGIPKNAVEIKPYTYQFDSFAGMKTHLRENERDRFIVKKIIRHSPPKYEKGMIQKDGSVSPFSLGEF